MRASSRATGGRLCPHPSPPRGRGGKRLGRLTKSCFVALGGNMIRGVLLPIITPFDDKVHIDEQMMRQLVDFHIKAGVQGLFVLGSTGQGPAMTTEERKQ
ncbi:MAG: dihydrodipicolinate synthase family protein, partial [Candidatus Binatia bacterium]